MTQPDVTIPLRERLIGTWHLIACTLRSVTGETWYPYGSEPKGMLMYDPAGHVIVVLMRSGRPPFASGDLLTGTPEEIREAFLGFDAYCGTYSIDEVQQTVTHHIAACRFPNWEGTDQLRLIQFDENGLHLHSLPYTLSGTEWTVEISWQRAS
jgi:hypothetical protein